MKGIKGMEKAKHHIPNDKISNCESRITIHGCLPLGFWTLDLGSRLVQTLQILDMESHLA